MNLSALKENLIQHHHAFTVYIDGLTETDFLATPNDKWSAGQQMTHIFMSVHPVAKLVANKAVMQEKFGTTDQPGRTYEQLVSAYLQVLAEGAKAGPRFTPEVTNFSEKAEIITRITEDIQSISSNLEGYSEAELDQLVIPHPVMGPFSLREMLMFTIYHVQHHEMKIKENLISVTSSD